MTTAEQLLAIEAIKLAKARYLRGVDTGDGALVRSVLAEDCVLDYRGCCVDPATGHDHFPALSVVMQGREAYAGDGLAAVGVVSAHYAPNCEIEIVDAVTATGIWAMTDRLILPGGGGQIIGHGHYHETYEFRDGTWRIKTLRIVRTRVETLGAGETT